MVLALLFLPVGAAPSHDADDPDRPAMTDPDRPGNVDPDFDSHGHSKAFDPDKDWDDAVGRNNWLKLHNRHHSPDNMPAAWHHHLARQQAHSLPVIVPHSAAPPPAPATTPVGGGTPTVPAPSAPPTFGSSCDWSPIGPMPLSIASPYGFTSGLVDTIAVDTANDPTGNTMYLGACRGGVWKTTNGLAASPTYTLLSDPHQTLSVGAIGLDSSVNPPILYVGTGDYNGDDWFGEGIFKSTNGGVSWTLTSTATGGISLYGMTFSKILVDPVTPAIVLAGATDGGGGDPGGPFPTRFGIYRSTDNGTTWTKITTVTTGTALGNAGCQDLTYDPTTATYYAAFNGLGVYKSTNQGASWAQTTTPFPSGTAASGANFTRACVAARGGKLWCLIVAGNTLSTPVSATDTGLSESDDNGNTWSAVSLANTLASGLWYQAGYDLYVAAPPGSTNILIGNIDVWSASPAGAATSWVNTTNSFSGGIVHCDQHAVAFAGPSTWYVGNDGGVWDTTNAGTSWHDGNTNLDTVLFYHVGADPNNTGYFLGGAQDNGTSATKNQGVTWHEIAGSDGSCVGANLGTPGQYFAEYYNVSLLISTNYGNTWPNGVGNPPITDQSAFFVPFKVVQGAPASVLLGTTRVWEGPANTAGGTGWNPISPSFSGTDIVALDVCRSNPQVIYAVTGDPQVDVTTNGGASWTNISTGLLPKFQWIVNCITVDPTNPATAYIPFQQVTGSSAGHVYATTNTGGTWTDISGNLPDAPANWVMVDPEVPTDVYVATDVGVFVTQQVNGTATAWSQLGTQLPDTTIETLDISQTCPRVVVAGTYGRSAWAICPVDTGTCATSTPTATVNSTSTATPSKTATATPSSTTSSTPSTTPTRTPTLTPSNTATSTATASATASPTSTPSSSATASPSATASRTPTFTPASTVTPTATSTATSSVTSSTTSSPTSSTTPTISSTVSRTMTPSPTLTATSSATASPSATADSTATGTATSSATASSTTTASLTASSTPSLTITPTASRTPTASPTSTGSFTPTLTPTASATSTASRTATLTAPWTPTSTPTATPTKTSTASATVSFTTSWTPTPSATSTATSTASATPTAKASDTPTPLNTLTPTASITSTPPASGGLVVFPNPASGPGPVTLRLTLSNPADQVEIAVYTLAFRRVDNLTLRDVPSGTTDVALPLTDEWGHPLADGLYYIVARTPQGRFTTRLLVLR